MPTYEYKCNNCEEVFERFHKITDPPLKECPVCGGKLTRLISGGIGVIFKGSGFYVTDNKSSSHITTSPSKEKGTNDTKGTKDSKNITEKEGKKDSPIKNEK